MSIRKNKSGSRTVDEYDKSGKRIVKAFRRSKDARDFQAKIRNEKLEEKMLRGGLKSPRTEFVTAIEEVRIRKSTLRPKSRQKYFGVLDQFEKFITVHEIKYIDGFTAEHANLLYTALIKGRVVTRDGEEITLKPKPKTVNFYLQTYRSIFRNEMEKGRLVKDPMNHIKYLKVDRKRPDYYTEKEVKRFFEQEMNDAYRSAFLGLFHTGMRFGELANLTWDNVDLDKRLITVAYSDDFDVKTDSSQRLIPINTVLYNLLTKLNQERKNPKYVFTSIKDDKLSERTLLSVCKRIARLAGITNRSYLHKFRHTFATHLIQQGVAIERLQKLLGHTDIKQTLVYAYVKTDNLHQDLELLTNLTHPLRGVVNL